MDDEVSGLIASPGTYAQSPLFLHGPSPYFVPPDSSTRATTSSSPRQPARLVEASSRRGKFSYVYCVNYFHGVTFVNSPDSIENLSLGPLFPPPPPRFEKSHKSFRYLSDYRLYRGVRPDKKFTRRIMGKRGSPR